MKLIFLSIAVGICLSACVTASEVGNLVPETTQSVPITSALKNAVSVTNLSVEGSGAFERQISSNALEEALAAALEKNGLLAMKQSQYNVIPILLHLEQPAIGIDMKVIAKINYLVKDSTGKILMDKTISTPYTAKMGEAFVGATRVKRANEGAVRENISEFISEFLTWSQEEISFKQGSQVKVNID